MLAKVERSSHGTCRLRSDEVANFPIPLPPLYEQKRIIAKIHELMSLCDEVEIKTGSSRVCQRITPHRERCPPARGQCRGLVTTHFLDRTHQGSRSKHTVAIPIPPRVATQGS